MGVILNNYEQMKWVNMKEYLHKCHEITIYTYSNRQHIMYIDIVIYQCTS